MPNIQEFEGGNLALHPSSTGTDARAGTARRIGGFYNQQASAEEMLARETAQLGSQTARLGSETATLGSEKGAALADAGRRIGSAFEAAGGAAVKYLEHQEINQGFATYAQLQDDLTRQWNETAKNANPNDPSVAAKFRETVLQPALEKYTSAFSTENGQRFAETKAESLRLHLFEKTSADMSSLAGIAVRKNLADSATFMSNTAITDPSSVPNLIANIDHSIAGVIASSPTMTAVDAARVHAEVSTSLKAAIVKAGAIGAIQQSANPEATAADWIKKYPEFINGAEAQTLGSNARQQIRARNYDHETNRRRDKEITQDRSTELTNQYLIDVRSKDPKIANDPTAAKILNDPNLTKTDKNNLLNYVDRQLKPETDSRISQQTFVGLLREMRDPTADSDKVMQKAWDARLTDPGKPNSLSEKDFNQFRAEVVARKTPEGAALEHDRNLFFKQYAGAIAGSGYDPVVGSPKIYAAEMDARRVEADLKRKGLDPHLAYDPGSEYFIGKPQRMQKYQGSMQGDLETRAAAPKSVNLTADGSQITSIDTVNLPPAEPAKRTPGNLYDTPKGKMQWTGTGWVKP